MKPLQDIGEDALIRQLLQHVPLATGLAAPGDDCAVIDSGGETLQLLKTDALVCGVHFLPETEARRVGWKAAARVISDLAAMGGGRLDHLL
ncbi:MAG TPA: AIR synthase related protein, partial [Luteolibacter sp.]|nr:AIR synthase related protein [Luteolibacter sp.]